MKELRFSFQELDDDVNKPDLFKWLIKDKLIALVDEEKGGIIGYFHRDHEEEFFKLLNKLK